MISPQDAARLASVLGKVAGPTDSSGESIQPVVLWIPVGDVVESLLSEPRQTITRQAIQHYDHLVGVKPALI